jgi:hypothetical protein
MVTSPWMPSVGKQDPVQPQLPGMSAPTPYFMVPLYGWPFNPQPLRTTAFPGPPGLWAFLHAVPCGLSNTHTPLDEVITSQLSGPGPRLHCRNVLRPTVPPSGLRGPRASIDTLTTGITAHSKARRCRPTHCPSG